MATGNFKYENRCVVVTNDDIEFGNMPKLGKTIDSSYSHNTDEVILPDSIIERIPLNFFAIGFTNGYYEDGCIDYVDLGYTLDDVMGYYYTFDVESKKEFIENVQDEFPYLSKYAINKAIGNVKGLQVEEWIDNAVENVKDMIMEREEEECNRLLDEIKKYYGYEEVVASARFSNGEVWYNKVG